MKERDPEFNVVEVKSGFATYRWMNLEGNKAVYIEDIYVVPEHRKGNIATELSEIIQKKAKERGCTYLLGTVDVSKPTATDSIKVLLAHGMSLVNYHEHNTLWFKKEI